MITRINSTADMNKARPGTVIGLETPRGYAVAVKTKSGAWDITGAANSTMLDPQKWLGADILVRSYDLVNMAEHCDQLADDLRAIAHKAAA